MLERPSKIRLSRETFRNLDRKDHERVAGGTPVPPAVTNRCCSNLSWPWDPCIPSLP